MKLIIIFIIYSSLSFALDCKCNLLSGHPLEGKVTSYYIQTFSGKYYGLPTPRAKLECLSDCQNIFETKVDEYYLKQELRDIGEKLAYEGQLGFNCTGATTLKFPVQVRAYLGESSLGISHTSFHNIHMEKVCFH
jgi:hypothetical protein